MHNIIEIFVADCDFCKETLEKFLIGKCAQCELKVYDVRIKNEEVKNLINKYRVTAVPTVIINGKIKIVGKPNFNVFCSPEFYSFLEKNFSTNFI